MGIPDCTLFDTKNIYLYHVYYWQNLFRTTIPVRTWIWFQNMSIAYSVPDSIFCLSKYSNRLDNSSLKCLMIIIIIIIYIMPAYSRWHLYLLKNYSRHDSSIQNLHVTPNNITKTFLFQVVCAFSRKKLRKT